MTEFAHLTDRELMRLVADGTTDAFDELVHRYRPALVRVAQSRLKRPDWAEDAVQETFLRAFRARLQYDERFGFRTWLWTILLNQCRSQSRGRVTEVVCAADGDPSSSGEPRWDEASVVSREQLPQATLMAKERSALLEAFLDRLRPVEADALRLRFFAALTFQEIADTMGSSLSTAKNRVRHGLLRLSDWMQSEHQLAEAIIPPGRPLRADAAEKV